MKEGDCRSAVDFFVGSYCLWALEKTGRLVFILVECWQYQCSNEDQPIVKVLVAANQPRVPRGRNDVEATVRKGFLSTGRGWLGSICQPQ
jgi:hypothetical protein